MPQIPSTLGIPTTNLKSALEKLVAHFDRNQDGTLDEAETARVFPLPVGMNKSFTLRVANVDTNGDQTIQMDELHAYCQQQGFTAVTGRSVATSAEDQLLSDLFANALDADGDGSVARAELDSAANRLLKHDLNDDEILDWKELQSAPPIAKRALLAPAANEARTGPLRLRFHLGNDPTAEFTGDAIGTEDAAAVESWRQLLRGLWESGLRLAEAMAMHWEADGAIVPHKHRSGLLLLHIPAKLQKSRKAQDVPTTPAFTGLLESLGNRKGWVFNPVARRSRKGQGRLTAAHVGRLISLIGQKANIVVSASGKTASAHDLRRSFGQRMADAGLPPRDLQAIMRHASFTTTEAYCFRDRAQDQGQRIAAYLGTVTKKPAEQKAVPVSVSR